MVVIGAVRNCASVYVGRGPGPYWPYWPYREMLLSCPRGPRWLLPQGHETGAFCRRESDCAFKQDRSQRAESFPSSRTTHATAYYCIDKDAHVSPPVSPQGCRRRSIITKRNRSDGKQKYAEKKREGEREREKERERRKEDQRIVTSRTFHPAP